MLKEMGVAYVVSKAQNELHAKVLLRIGADRVVFPERDMGERVAHNLIATNILEYIELSPEHSIIEFAVLKSWVGKDLRDINLRAKYGVTVVAIRNMNDDQINVSPKADNEIKEGDILIVIGDNDDLKKLERKTD
jgi:trk system potassium uptake protein TrkA